MAANPNPPVPVPPVPPAPPPAALTVLNGMVACGLSTNGVQANVGTSPARRVAEQIFFNDFSMCLTLTDKEIDNNFKSFADLPIAEGRVKVMPGIIKMVKAFTQHIAHIIRLQLNPEEHPFVPAQMVILTRQRILQTKFEAENKSEIDGAKPSLFTTTTTWVEWNRAFYNYLKLIPSTREIPLCYVIRVNDATDRTTRTLFQDEYIYVAPLTSGDISLAGAVILAGALLFVVPPAIAFSAFVVVEPLLLILRHTAWLY